MHQATAEVMSNEKILERFERLCAPPLPRPRTVTGSWLIWLKCPEIARSARPGQFVMVRCDDDTLLRRPMSIHRVKGDTLVLYFSAWQDGKGTQWFSERHPGDKIDILGPLGNGFDVGDAGSLLLIAGGTGIAPLVFLGERALEQGKAVTLLCGASTGSQLYPAHLLPPGLKCITTAEDGDKCDKKGRVTDLIPEYAGRADKIFCCGPIPMYRTIAEQSLLGGKPCQVSLEVRMGCGFGVCYGCSIKTKHGLKEVCKDGPVFDMDDILWDELAGV
jgi:dihydroorotate dehydrogenase electron transfer subunit